MAGRVVTVMTPTWPCKPSTITDFPLLLDFSVNCVTIVELHVTAATT